ncbi:hypothetical protein [Alysiella filiformis]|uniref:Lipoprotein n=1 Tax=Alysiella filiformis DSM 16848 TaxID=1120981 RepID=A0A286E2D0_9NEIS|nr:hypothetical protein [Alysiella filiformis]QMT30878.1 hypothetical protein H3L97_09095 [Alysiella filiformis]UBQ56137.1 hypothetical protein JF568_11375 [Alysiella filiformis DSM 16848]SOD65039.1 hypothetical protein SAMN02746062_00170 [Alysiella filiformis DSM 16848]
MNKIIIVIASCALAACALTPEQQAKQHAAQIAYQQNLQIMLAQQCDKETADLMAQKFRQPEFANEKARQDFNLKYLDKVNDPIFQSCYKMAWQAHVSQQQLRQMRDYYDDWYAWRGFHRPWGWW